MKTKLKEITDSTINELLKNEIILPSIYFQCFDKHAKTSEVDVHEESFEKELSDLIIDEFNVINNYVNEAITTIDLASGLTLDAQKAIKENNTLLLKNLYNQIGELKEELESITDNIYKDYLTKVNNKKWLYHKYLTKDAKFKDDAIIALIDVSDYEYISSTYNKLISNNLLIYISNYLKEKLKDEGLEFELTRYLSNKFIITFNEDDISSIVSLIENISSILFGTTLKSNSGIIIKPTFEFSMVKVKKDENFHEILTNLVKNIEAKKEK